MEKFTTFTAISAPLNIINIDTDMIIPKQFLKTIKRTGLGANVFDEMRFNTDGSEIADFVLNQDYYRTSGILVAGDNFGCGSSREHAPWALADFGIKTIIAHSFADIFYNNCFKNAILPIKLPQEQISVLMENAKNEGDTELNINLEEQTITNSKGDVIKFELDAFRKKCLLEGLDDIGLTMQKFDKIKAFEAGYQKQVPWLFDKKDLNEAC